MAPTTVALRPCQKGVGVRAGRCMYVGVVASPLRRCASWSGSFPTVINLLPLGRGDFADVSRQTRATPPLRRPPSCRLSRFDACGCPYLATFKVDSCRGVSARSACSFYVFKQVQLLVLGSTDGSLAAASDLGSTRMTAFCHHNQLFNNMLDT
eukprot:6212581-Pleurochrysis_carterae.AAC.3